MGSHKRKRGNDTVTRRAAWQRIAAQLVLKKGLNLAGKAVKKRLRSVTKTRTKTRNADHEGVKESDGGASTSRYTKLNKGPKRAKTRQYDTNILKEVRPFVAQGPSNRSSAFFVSYFDYTDIQKMLADLWNQIPATITGGQTAITNQMRPYFLSAVGKFTFSNMTTSGSWIELYDVHCKDSTDIFPTQEIQLGLRDEEGDSTAIDNNFRLGTKPTMSKRFKRTWAVDKTTRIFLRPGEQHVHFIKYGPHKAMDNSYLRGWNNRIGAGGTPSTQEFIKGITRGLLWFQYGNVALDSGAGAQTGNNAVGTALTKNAVVYDVAYRYSMLRFNNTTVTNVDTLITPTGGGGQVIVNEDTSTSIVANVIA